MMEKKIQEAVGECANVDSHEEGSPESICVVNREGWL